MKLNRITRAHALTLLGCTISSRILCALLLTISSYLPLFDSSPSLLLPQPTSIFSRWSSTLLRWDAFHYTHIAHDGYIYENEWAFLPGTPYVMRTLAQILNMLSNTGNEPKFQDLLVTGALAAFVFDGTFTLYHLTLHHFNSSSIAFLTALLSLLSSSPATLRHAAYAEPFFAYLSYKGMLCCARKQWLFASLFFALASAFRSNGVMLAGFLVWGMVIDPILRGQKRFTTFFLCALLTTVPALPFAYHQYTAYRAFCIHSTPPPAPWCSNHIPSIYTYVQSKYWNVGILRYWTLSQLPNFLLAAPVLVLLLYSSLYHIVHAFLPRLRVLFFSTSPKSKSEINETHKPPSASPFLSPAVTPHALHALFITLTLLFAAHTQIILRLSSALPFTYWAAAQLWVEHPRWARVWTGWCVIWGSVSLLLWNSFLPPA